VCVSMEGVGRRDRERKNRRKREKEKKVKKLFQSNYKNREMALIVALKFGNLI
jgi:hypothetical protein